ncbi:MAG: lipoyl synthase [Calditrichaceae bacterium]|nr:lipoyl synthase [Calditrichaceae bacterium]
MPVKTNQKNIQQNSRLRRPGWLKVRLGSGQNFTDVRSLVGDNKLHTVCESARCPNIGECWSRKTATFMILGNVCTRSCTFCNITTGKPPVYDREEPQRVADAVMKLNLRHAVITSVARDDLKDGGSSIFAATIKKIREMQPGCTIEVLIPDFQGDPDALDIVLDAGPDILNHNLETVERLQRPLRVQAKYHRSLSVLKHAKEKNFITKSGIMVGVGETYDEIYQTFRDLRDVDCNILTVGQYLPPTKQHYPIERFYHPDEFTEIKENALAMGFTHVESGPMVRSSYHADEQVPKK